MRQLARHKANANLRGNHDSIEQLGAVCMCHTNALIARLNRVRCNAATRIDVVVRRLHEPLRYLACSVKCTFQRRASKRKLREEVDDSFSAVVAD